MSKLVIVESPAKAKTINRYLGKDYQVRACMGHVRDLPKSKMGVDIENGFAPTYVVSPDRKKTIAELKKLAAKADEVYLATDLDREGEAIAWHLAEALKLPPKKIRRVVFNEITKSAIREAFSQPGTINENKVNAQQARRILDRVVGYELSPLLWRGVRRGLSAGRVQSVAVRLIVDREREIEAFKSEEYWELEARLAPREAPAEGPSEFTAKYKRLIAEESAPPREEEPAGRLPNESAATSLVEEIKTAPYVITRLDQKERAAAAAPPFNTSTLQQQASIQLHFSTRKTMVLAQQLYEGVDIGDEGAVGLITYMRTDSFSVSEQAIRDCRDYIGSSFPKEYLPEAPLRYRSGKDAQGAHEAVRPTAVEYTPERVKPHLERDQFRLYEMIWNRFVASQMAPARIAVTEVEVTAGRAVFGVQGKRLLFDGQYRISGFDTKNEVILPALSEGETLDLLELLPSQHFTKPPPRFSEASLVRTLEKLGIGRPSTYAPIISTIQQRKYVLLEKRQFHATELAKVVTDQLVQYFSDIMDVKFTSQMEDRLDEVEEERADWVQALREFYGPFSADMKKAREQMKRPEPEMTEHKCEKCGEPMLKRWSPNGYFLGCSAYPKCRSTVPLDDEGKPAPRPEPEQTDEKCEKCGSPMVIRTGRFGRFIACSNYPKCRTSRSLEKAQIELPEELKVCDKCGKPMAVRRSRRGPFVGCTGYPECRNAKPLPKK
jgi:DNA topoisomerase-1